MNLEKASLYACLSLAVLYILIPALALFGWVWGLVRFVSADFEPPYRAEAIYAIGIPTGLNAVLGYFDFGK